MKRVDDLVPLAELARETGIEKRRLLRKVKNVDPSLIVQGETRGKRYVKRSALAMLAASPETLTQLRERFDTFCELVAQELIAMRVALKLKPELEFLDDPYNRPKKRKRT